MMFCCNVLKNSAVIGIAMAFIGNKFSFKLNLQFMKYMHANTTNKIQEPNNFLIYNFFI